MKTALVTGGSRGIGRAVALAMSKTDVGTIVLNYLENDDEAEKTRAKLEENDKQCILVRANIAHPAGVDELFDAIEGQIAGLDYFVHCAAITSFKPISTIKPNQWDITMNTNARSFLQCVQKAAILMTEGRVVAVSSLGGQRTVPNYGAMGPTKAALEAVVRYLAFELGPRGIRVNAVAGGLVDTQSLDLFPHKDELIRNAVERTPLKRLATPDDIADIVLFLLSPAARWVQGQTITADGGMSLS